MPGNPHPAVAPFTGHNDDSIVAYEQLHARVVVADADEVRNTDFSSQYGGLFVRSTNSNYSLDTGSVEADDGVDVIIDAAGNHFIRVEPTVGLESETVFTAAGDLTIADDSAYDVFVINKAAAAATAVYLPDAADRIGAPVTIVDGKFDAATNNISLYPKVGSGQTIMGSAGPITIDSNGASIRLRARADGSGWY